MSGLFGLPLAFTAPLALLGLLALPALWFLLRVTPPRPKRAVFPPLVLLERLKITEETPSRTPLWIVLMRMALAALLVFAFAGPVARPADNPLAAEADGPLVIVIDTGWGSAAGFAAQFDPDGDPDMVIADFIRSRVVDQSALQAIEDLALKYEARGKTLRLRHLTRDCHRLLNHAGQLMVDSDDDPDYEVAVDYDVRTGAFGTAH